VDANATCVTREVLLDASIFVGALEYLNPPTGGDNNPGWSKLDHGSYAAADTRALFAELIYALVLCARLELDEPTLWAYGEALLRGYNAYYVAPEAVHQERIVAGVKQINVASQWIGNVFSNMFVAPEATPWPALLARIEAAAPGALTCRDVSSKPPAGLAERVVTLLAAALESGRLAERDLTAAAIPLEYAIEFYFEYSLVESLLAKAALPAALLEYVIAGSRALGTLARRTPHAASTFLCTPWQMQILRQLCSTDAISASARARAAYVELAAELDLSRGGYAFAAEALPGSLQTDLDTLLDRTDRSAALDAALDLRTRPDASSVRMRFEDRLAALPPAALLSFSNGALTGRPCVAAD
jgi:hypothetical protein